MIHATQSLDRHPFHSMCTYLGSFPPEVPNELLSRYFERRKWVLDPFCGGGTTLLQAGLLGFSTIGIDLNPLAVALSRAKMADFDQSEVSHRLSELARGFEADEELGLIPEGFAQLYHPRTLQQLVYVRRVLDPMRSEDALILGALLGIMHGKRRRDGSSAYLSIDMPNTFSMSPGYVRKFVSEHGLERPPADLFGKLRSRIDWLLRAGPPAFEGDHRVFLGDGATLHQVLAAQGFSRVGGILTSPPYLGVLRYGAFNWIRLWLLSKGPAEVDRTLDSTDSLDRYVSFMASFLRSAAKVTRPGAPVVLVIGDIEQNGETLPLAERTWSEIGGVVPFEQETVLVDDFDSDGKTTRIWGDQRRGRATPRDKVLVLRRS